MMNVTAKRIGKEGVSLVQQFINKSIHYDTICVEINLCIVRLKG